MRKGIARSLIFTCSLLLALPQGWCCLFALQTEKTATAKEDTATTHAKSTKACCPCCAQNPDPERGPKDKPSGPSKRVCCCPDRDATLSSSSSIEKADSGFLVLLPPLDPVAPTLTLVEEVVSNLLLPTLALHVVNCVWLC